jgi:hypothetical protein
MKSATFWRFLRLPLAALLLSLSCLNAGAVVLEWDANAPSENVTKYTLYWGTSSGQYLEHADTGLATQYEVTGLALLQTYYFAVTATGLCNDPEEVCESDYSNEVSYQMDLPPPMQATDGNILYEEIEGHNMSFSLIQSNSSFSSTHVSLTGVTAGNLIVLVAKWENNTTTGISATDGTSALSIGTRAASASSDGVRSQLAWLLSANGGNKTYTVTFPSGAAIITLAIYEFSYSGELSVDTQAIGAGDSNTAQTENFSTTGSDELIVAGNGGWSSSQTPFSNYLIGGESADGSLFIDWDGNYPGSAIFFKAFSAAKTNIFARNTFSSSDEWSICAVAFKAAAGGTASVSSSIDSLIQKTGIAKTASVDSLIRLAGIEKTASIDSLLYLINSGAVSIDSLIQAIKSESISVDALIQAVKSGSISVDALIYSILTSSANLDAILTSAISSSTFLDALIQRIGNLSAAEIDALIQAAKTATGSIDALISKGYLAEMDIDALLQKSGNVSVADLDAILKKLGIEKSAEIDALIQSGKSSASEIDALLFKQFQTQAGIDSFLQAGGLTVETVIDALIQAGKTGAVSIDAILLAAGQNVINTSLDALIQAVMAGQVSIDALLQKGYSATADLDAILFAIGSESIGLDSMIQAAMSGHLSMDALLQMAGSKSIDMDALIFAGQSGQLSLDAILTLLSMGQVDLDALLQASMASNIGLDAIIGYTVIPSGEVIATFSVRRPDVSFGVRKPSVLFSRN